MDGSNGLLDITALEIYVYLIWLALIFVIGLPINALLVVVIWRTRKLHSVHNFLMVNLCLCNALTCALPTSFTFVALVYHLTQHNYVTVICYLRHVTIFVGLFPSFLTLILLGFEKYDAIVRPFSKRLSMSRLKVTLVLLWLTTITGVIGVSLEYWMVAVKKCFLKTGGSSPYLYYALTMGTFFLMVGATFYCYIRIVFALTSHQNDFSSAIRQQHRLEKRPLQMIAILILTFLFLWLPTGVVRLTRRSAHNDGALAHAYVATGVLMYCSAICHPITCFVMSSQLRKAVAVWWGKATGKNRRQGRRRSCRDSSSLRDNSSRRSTLPTSVQTLTILDETTEDMK